MTSKYPFENSLTFLTFDKSELDNSVNIQPVQRVKPLNIKEIIGFIPSTEILPPFTIERPKSYQLGHASSKKLVKKMRANYSSITKREAEELIFFDTYHYRKILEYNHELGLLECQLLKNWLGSERVLEIQNLAKKYKILTPEESIKKELTFIRGESRIEAREPLRTSLISTKSTLKHFELDVDDLYSKLFDRSIRESRESLELYDTKIKDLELLEISVNDQMENLKQSLVSYSTTITKESHHYKKDFEIIEALSEKFSSLKNKLHEVAQNYRL